MGTEPAICRAGSRRPRGRARAEALGARSECPTTGIAASTGTSPFETPRPARLSRRRNRAAAPRWSKTNTQPDRLTDLVDAVAPSADVPTCRPPAADRRGQTMSVATAPSACGSRVTRRRRSRPSWTWPRGPSPLFQYFSATLYNVWKRPTGETVGVGGGDPRLPDTL